MNPSIIIHPTNDLSTNSSINQSSFNQFVIQPIIIIIISASFPRVKVVSGDDTFTHPS